MAKDNPVIYGMEEAVSWQNDSQQPPAGFNDATATLLATLNHSSTLGDVHEAIVDEFISELAAFALDQENHRPHHEEELSILAQKGMFPDKVPHIAA